MINIFASFLVLFSAVLFTASSENNNSSPQLKFLEMKEIYEKIPVTYQSSFSPTPTPLAPSEKKEENATPNTREAQTSQVAEGVVVNSDSLPAAISPTLYISNHPAPTEGGLAVPDQVSSGEPGSVEGNAPSGNGEANGPEAPIPNPDEYKPLEIHGPGGVVTVSH